MQPSSLLIYKEQLPNECLVALCAEQWGCKIRPLSELIDTIPPGSHCVLLSNYWNQDDMAPLYKKGTTVTIIPGTPAFLAIPLAKEIMGAWLYFSEPNTQAWFAYGYWKTLSFEERRTWVNPGSVNFRIPDDLVSCGKIYCAKETSMANAVRQLAQVHQTTSGLSFALADLGMSPGIHATHEALRQENIECSLVHYLTKNEKGSLIHRWSTRAKTQAAIPNDRFFTDVLCCKTFGPPFESCKPGDIREGTEGRSFSKVLKYLSNR